MRKKQKTVKINTNTPVYSVREDEFIAYKAVKKEKVSAAELFSDKDYIDKKVGTDKSINSQNKNIKVLKIVGFIIFFIGMGLLIYYMISTMMQRL